SPSPTSRPSTSPTAATTASPAPTRRSRWSPCGPPPPRPPGSTSPPSRPRLGRGRSAPPPSPSRTARSGGRRGGGPSRARPARSCCSGRGGDPRPRGVAGAHLPPRRGGRRDGRGPAPGGVEPEHQGSGRLLRRRVRRGRPPPRPGRAHPRPPRRAPRGGGGGGGRLRRRPRPRRPRARQPPPRRRHPPQPPPPEPAGVPRRPADHVLVNDPYAGGTHLNDLTLVTPVFAGGRRIGWVANRAHHADVGGAAPGSLPADATEIQQEGLRIPPTRWSPELRALVLAASRTPDERAGDLDAQVGANRVGAERLAELAGEPFHEVIAYGERRMRAALADLPDGTWRFEDVLDSTGSA